MIAYDVFASLYWRLCALPAHKMWVTGGGTWTEVGSPVGKGQVLLEQLDQREPVPMEAAAGRGRRDAVGREGHGADWLSAVRVWMVQSRAKG